MVYLCVLWFFMMMIGSYEPGIHRLIKYHMKTYTFETNQELQEAVHLWCINRPLALKKYGHIRDWDVSLITDMNYLFTNVNKLGLPAFNDDNIVFFDNFNDDISRWDVSSVTNMESMFWTVYEFNQPIGDWDVSNVENMNFMFSGTKAFNQPIGNWDVSSVTKMNGLFFGAIEFNQPIGKWNVSNVVSMERMFVNATKFNQHIGKWDVSNVIHMKRMFERAVTFNQYINWTLHQDNVSTNVFDGASSLELKNLRLK